MQYKGRRSSADTIVNLARFNALVSGAHPCTRFLPPLPPPCPPPCPPLSPHPAAASLEFSGAVVKVNPRVAKAAFGLLVNSKRKPKQQELKDEPDQQISAAAPRAAPTQTPRSLLQKRATMQLLLPLLQQSGYMTDSASTKTMSDVADAALLALWLQRARAAAVAAADHASFAAAYPAAAADISSALLHQVPQLLIRITLLSPPASPPSSSTPPLTSSSTPPLKQIIGQLGWKLASSKDVLAIAPGDTAAVPNLQYSTPLADVFGLSLQARAALPVCSFSGGAGSAESVLRTTRAKRRREHARSVAQCSAVQCSHVFKQNEGGHTRQQKPKSEAAQCHTGSPSFTRSHAPRGVGPTSFSRKVSLLRQGQ